MIINKLSIKKDRKFYSIIVSMTLALSIWTMAACGEDKSTSQLAGAKIYHQYCVSCHGATGKLRLNGSADLSTSILTKEQVKNITRTGKGLMTPYQEILTATQIDQVADFILTLRN